MNGVYEHESARCRVTYSQMVPPHLRGRCREVYGVKALEQGKGHGTALMRKLCDSADSARLCLLLTVDDGNKRLVAWYAGFGFTPIQADPLVMARMPANG